MTAKEKKQLENIKSIVREAYDKVNENDGYYVVDVSHLIEELAVELGFDITFNAQEISDLKKAKFKIDKTNTEATRIYKKITITVFKNNFDCYLVKFGSPKRALFDIYDLNEISGKDLEILYKEYIS